MALLKSSFSCNSLILCGSRDGDPLSPPKGEAAQREHPPAPSFAGFFHQPSDDYCNIGGCPGGGGQKHDVQRTPRSDCLFLSRISTEPPLLQFLQKNYHGKANSLNFPPRWGGLFMGNNRLCRKPDFVHLFVDLKKIRR
jgi:hypothetical protein